VRWRCRWPDARGRPAAGAGTGPDEHTLDEKYTTFRKTLASSSAAGNPGRFSCSCWCRATGLVPLGRAGVQETPQGRLGEPAPLQDMLGIC